MVSSIATLYKKLRLETHENIGWGKIHLPEIELHTTSYWVALGPTFDSWRRDELDIALNGAGRALLGRQLPLLTREVSRHSIKETKGGVTG